MGRLATRPAPVKRVPKHEVHFCDRCGFSAMDGNGIARAKYVVITLAGKLYFCGAHYRKYGQRIAEHGYVVEDLTPSV